MTTEQIAARPILFSAPMVRALLDGSKTQTRRVVKPQPWCNKVDQWLWERRPGQHIAFHPELDEDYYPGTKLQHVCPYGQPGDTLWARETWACVETRQSEKRACISYRAENEMSASMLLHPKDVPDHSAFDSLRPLKRKWRPSIHMPRWASRITLKVTGVRVERVQDIKYEDSIAEGIEDWTNRYPGNKLRCWKNYHDNLPVTIPGVSFQTLWDSINAKRGHAWASNPWVWVVELEREGGES